MSLPSCWGVSKSMPKIAARSDVLLRAFLEDGDDPRLAPAEALGDELGGEDRLPRPRRPRHQQAVALGDPAAEHRVQSAIPVESRRSPCTFSGRPVRPKVRGKACTPSSVMRNVCSPGTDAWPRSFMTCSFRTIEFRSTCWYSQKSPSATVKTGLSRISPSAYSPIRKVVACQLVRCRASRWTNPWSSDRRPPPLALSAPPSGTSPPRRRRGWPPRPP